MKIATGILSLAILGSVIAAAAQISPYPWDTHIADIKSKLEEKGTIREFTPPENPDYRNKVVSFIAALDEMAPQSMVILQHRHGKSARDYLFFRDRLVSIMDENRSMSAADLALLQNTLKKELGEPKSEQQKGFIILNYSNPQTKGMLYLQDNGDGTSRIRLYLYDRKIFRKMLNN